MDVSPFLYGTSDHTTLRDFIDTARKVENVIPWIAFQFGDQRCDCLPDQDFRSHSSIL